MGVARASVHSHISRLLSQVLAPDPARERREGKGERERESKRGRGSEWESE